MRFGCITIPLLILLLIGFGVIGLVTWDWPAPSRIIERTIPDSRFDR